MSGGSFDYLYCKEPAELFNYSETLKEMETALWEMGANDIAKDTQRLIEYVESARNRIGVLMDNLQDVFHAVEWYVSGDYGRDSLEKAIARYREGTDAAETKRSKLSGSESTGTCGVYAPPKPEPCKYCTDGISNAYQHTRYTELRIGKLGRRWILETRTEGFCPPFAMCTSKGEPRCSGFFINFCPECGRDLREEG